MQLRRLSLLAALVGAAAPFASHAGTMDYSYVELGYVDTEIDDNLVDLEGDGFALRGSLAVHENFFVFASYEDLGFDFGIDATALTVGAGGRWPLKDKLDLVGRFGIVNSEVELDRLGIEDDDDGFLIGARLRTELAPRFELEGGFDYVDLDEAGDDTSIVLEGRYFFIDQLSGGALVEISDDATTIGVGVRLTF